jgi:hypothetical protein
MTDPITWDSVVADNTSDDPLVYMMEKTETKEISRKPKGRPKKVIPSDNSLIGNTSPDPVPVPIPSILPTFEENLPTDALVSMFQKNKSQSPKTKPKKSLLRFSGDEKIPDDNSQPSGMDPDRATLLKMYKLYFRQPLLSKHSRKERIWHDSNLTSEIFQEIKLLETACSEDDPSQVLSSMWVAGMSVIETFGPVAGLETAHLGEVAGLTAAQPGFQTNMRELLIKYPYLRTMIGLGGYPEFKLLLTTTTLIKEIHDVNTRNRQASPGLDPLRPVPEDLRKQFDTL